jgi:MFS family permease
MFRLFSAFGPAIMLPLIAGLFSRKVNARGALAGLIAGAITGVTLVLTNIFLVQAYATDMAASPRLDFWLRSGWNSAATVLNVAATILGMWLGSRSRPAAAEEKARSEEFFANLEKPFLVEEKEGKPQAPLAFFRIIGLMLLAYGLAVGAVAVFIRLYYQDARAFRVDLIIAGVLMAMGALMQLGKKEKPV